MSLMHPSVLSIMNNSSDNKKIKSIADKFCLHEFNILSSGWTKVYYGMSAPGFEGKNFSKHWSTAQAEDEIPDFYKEKHTKLLELLKHYSTDYEPIDWQIDFKSGARFMAGVHHSELKYGVIEGMDAKVSADLGRLYQLVILAKAYHIFKDEKYKHEMLAQLLDFMAFNPPEYGAAWRANMNVAIRAANIIAAIDIIGWDNLNKEIAEEISESLLAHGEYIFENLEFPEEHFHPNHFIANIAGLLMVACDTTNVTAKAIQWRDYALKTLGEQIIYQSYPEGTNFEGATSYHCLVLEMLTGALLYAARHYGNNSLADIRKWLGSSLGEKSFSQYRNMFEVFRDIVQPDGLIPLIGDNDSGRFLYLEGMELDKRDYRFLAVTGAALFEDNTLLTEYDERHLEYAQTLLGQKIVPQTVPPLQSASWPDAGYYIMRDNDRGYAFINCGPVGTNGKGGHSHNDKLALTLQLEAKDIFVDPGIYAYTASEYFRNSYRSVKAHNTLCLAKEEQNRWGVANPWWGVQEETKCECLKWETSASTDVFSGRHRAYERLDCGAVHCRTIEWNKSARLISIVDELSGNGVMPAAVCGFMLAPECVITFYSDRAVTIKRDNVKLEISAEDGIWKTEPAFYSPEYGAKAYTQRLVLKLREGVSHSRIVITY